MISSTRTPVSADRPAARILRKTVTPPLPVTCYFHSPGISTKWVAGHPSKINDHEDKNVSVNCRFICMGALRPVGTGSIRPVCGEWCHRIRKTGEYVCQNQGPDWRKQFYGAGI